MKNKKIFILLPDGVGLRNFAYSNFYKLGISKGFEVVFWNNTMFNLSDLGFTEITISDVKTHPLTDLYKRVKINVELNQNKQLANDSIYDYYKFKQSTKGIKNFIKSLVVKTLIFTHNSPKGLSKIRKKLEKLERKTKFYFDSFETLKKEKPEIIFCTNQRTMLAIAPLLAAKDLNIPTATFIFSWDNLPKATKIIETDFYFVWSQHMKNELLYYYPYLKEEQIKITGTPQFELHYDKNKLFSKEEFFKKYNLDLTKKYICFTGDDVTSSPDDPLYLRDTAIAVQNLNLKGNNIGIIFRKCPADFSNRYDEITEMYKDVITTINPLWKPLNDIWNAILPQKEDDLLLSSIAEYTEMVVNLGSSTVFDFIAHQKPCGYFRYNQKIKSNKEWDIFKCYQFVHFRSMPNENPVIWINNPNELEIIIEKAVTSNAQDIIENAQKWFEKINLNPPDKASERIWESFDQIING
jgi:hypothetical protein